MRRFLLSLPSILLALLVFAVPTSHAELILTSKKTPCFCRYPATDPAWDPTESKWCPNEVYYAGDTAGASGASFATIMCGQICTAQGTLFAGITSLPYDEWQNYGNPVNMLAEETEQCVFDKDKPANYSKWLLGHNDCKDPLNAISTWVNACSYCYCTFKAGPGTPTECVGKTTMIHATSFPGKCDTLCKDNGYAFGEAADNYGDRCNFKTSNKCETAENAKQEGCARLSLAVEESKLNITSQGSVLTLPLPLSDIGVSGVVSRILQAVMGVVGAIALVLFVVSGLRWMLARGNQEEIAKAKKSLTWTTLGLIAIFASYAVLNFVIKSLTGK